MVVELVGVPLPHSNSAQSAGWMLESKILWQTVCTPALVMRQTVCCAATAQSPVEGGTLTALQIQVWLGTCCVLDPFLQQTLELVTLLLPAVDGAIRQVGMKGPLTTMLASGRCLTAPSLVGRGRVRYQQH